MKRVFSFVLCIAALFCMCSCAFAEVDLSGMSFDELVALKDQINLAIWNSAEWQEVEVPQGVWEVGADIPAGKWTIKATEGKISAVIIGNKLMNGGSSVNYEYGESIYSETSPLYSSGSRLEYQVDLESGQYVEITINSAIFTPYAGKPSLGFK